MKRLSIATDLIFTALTAGVVVAVSYKSNLGPVLSGLLGLTAFYYASAWWFAVLPALNKTAGGSEITAAAMLRTLRQGGDDADAGDLESGTRKKFKKVKLGFQPDKTTSEAPKVPLVPAPSCTTCQGSGHSAQDDLIPCSVCRGTGRKISTWHV